MESRGALVGYKGLQDRNGDEDSEMGDHAACLYLYGLRAYCRR